MTDLSPFVADVVTLAVLAAGFFAVGFAVLSVRTWLSRRRLYDGPLLVEPPKRFIGHDEEAVKRAAARRRASDEKRKSANVIDSGGVGHVYARRAQ